jgi:hypothetical protein
MPNRSAVTRDCNPNCNPTADNGPIRDVTREVAVTPRPPL